MNTEKQKAVGSKQKAASEIRASCFLLSAYCLLLTGSDIPAGFAVTSCPEDPQSG